MKDNRQKSWLDRRLGGEETEVRFSINLDDQNVIRTYHRPDYIFHILGALGVVLLGAIFYGSESFALPLIILPMIMIDVIVKRGITCTLDKNSGHIDYHRAGVLGSAYKEEALQSSISKIRYVQVKRQFWKQFLWRGFYANYQLGLALENGNVLPLSAPNLEFSECQEYAEKLVALLNDEIPIKAAGG